ncbi:hypothetical protein BT96DRAFT_949080 [Gymnopus androsaceus JB14]|uniref:Uncharacterized protein n=1 Tax=Gymnopus androsaceus JB14 TaxID=1447944 RepID=A0A6A4GMB8_9AGAR|nr:hypothetical protein BT96DRAFT_949080 [Gymnopus androsaceus JB14]
MSWAIRVQLVIFDLLSDFLPLLIMQKNVELLESHGLLFHEYMEFQMNGDGKKQNQRMKEYLDIVMEDKGQFIVDQLVNKHFRAAKDNSVIHAHCYFDPSLSPEFCCLDSTLTAIQYPSLDPGFCCGSSSSLIPGLLSMLTTILICLSFSRIWILLSMLTTVIIPLFLKFSAFYASILIPLFLQDSTVYAHCYSYPPHSPGFCCLLTAVPIVILIPPLLGLFLTNHYFSLKENKDRFQELSDSEFNAELSDIEMDSSSDHASSNYEAMDIDYSETIQLPEAMDVDFP